MIASRLILSTHTVRRAIQSTCRLQGVRNISRSAVVSKDDLPYHIVVGMPALSPTMETGILAEWYIQEGSSFAAGEALAKIETDKASIDFEAQDDGVVAKILMDAGTGQDIPVNTPIMVTVEEEGDVTAFANFTLPDKPDVPSKEPEPVASAVASTGTAAPVPPKVEAAAPPPTPAVAPPPPAPTSVPPPPVQDMIAAVAPVMSTGWGEFAKINSPIAKTLSKQQNDYVEKYGTTGQVPL